MEISNEVKAKIFAQYLGQKILFAHQDKWVDGMFCTPSTLNNIEVGLTNHTNLKLILKPNPKSMAFDEEDYLSFKKIEAISGELLKNATNKSDFFEKMILNSFLSYQYSISRGIDLPQYFLNGKTLQEAGLAIYENEK